MFHTVIAATSKVIFSLYLILNTLSLTIQNKQTCATLIVKLSNLQTSVILSIQQLGVQIRYSTLLAVSNMFSFFDPIHTCDQLQKDQSALLILLQEFELQKIVRVLALWPLLCDTYSRIFTRQTKDYASASLIIFSCLAQCPATQAAMQATHQQHRAKQLPSSM